MGKIEVIIYEYRVSSGTVEVFRNSKVVVVTHLVEALSPLTGALMGGAYPIQIELLKYVIKQNI